MHRLFGFGLAGGAGIVVSLLGSSCGSTEVTCEDLATCARPSGSDAGDGAVEAGPDVARDAAADAIEVMARPDAAPNGDADSGPVCDPGKKPYEDPCVIDDKYAVFVSPRGDAGVPDGTRAHPFSLVMAGLQTAKLMGRRVYVCDDGTGYREQLSIGAALDGLEIYGGFNCDWEYSTTRRATLKAPAPIAVQIAKLPSKLVVEDFAFQAADGAAPGESSLAAVVSESVGVRFTRVNLSAGKGAAGEPAQMRPPAAAAGAPGTKGNDACQPVRVSSPGVATCDAESSTGGTGGVGASASGNGTSGGTGTSAPAVAAPSGGGGRGEGEVASGSAWDCLSIDHGTAQGGAPGADGSAGTGAVSSGTLDATGWRATRGSAGGNGRVGQGGGGGGGARAPASCVSVDAASPTGASGGSGGAGGCGGKGGFGGGSGGSSIALAMFSSKVTLEACNLTTRDGGAGADASRGEQGGDGGRGGDHGVGVGSNAACDGARGGRGGNGGPGGGGAGGSSIAIVHVGMAPTTVLPAFSAVLGTAGSGGRDGNAQASGAGVGANGKVQDILAIP